MKKLMMMFVVISTLASALCFAKESKVLEGAVNVNAATAEELMLLPGVGEVKAKAIIEARTQKPFAKKEDLLVVKGIGDKTLAKWAPYIALEGKSTLHEVSGPVSQAQPAQAK